MQRLTEIEGNSFYDSFTPTSGVLLVIELVIHNQGETALDFSNRNFKLLQGSTQYTSTHFFGADEGYFFSEKLNPGLSKKGKLVFEIPEELDDRNLVLQYTGSIFDIPSGEINLDLT